MKQLFFQNSNLACNFLFLCTLHTSSCFRLQRYKLLKAIHNLYRPTPKSRQVVSDYKDTNFWKQFTTNSVKTPYKIWLFQTTKIQTFESNSQHCVYCVKIDLSCFRLQRYKLLKAIHNGSVQSHLSWQVVSDYKDTNFWKQFTTKKMREKRIYLLFQTTKIQTFESNSQQVLTIYTFIKSCFRLQRYKLLKAIHNGVIHFYFCTRVVSDYKDTNFWKQFTTVLITGMPDLGCFRLQRYKLLKAILRYKVIKPIMDIIAMNLMYFTKVILKFLLF